MLEIKWTRNLSWEVVISWSKNACLPILWASLIINWKITLKNVPRIWDVLTFLEIIEELWAKVDFRKDWVLELNTSNLNINNLNLEKIKKIRASILLLSPILFFFKQIKIPFPGWCSIWARPIDSHLNWLKKIGYKYKFDWENIELNWELKSWDIILNWWFWVTSTENLIVANVLRKGQTIIKNSAIEPHVMNLIDFLRKSWANIKIRYDHTIIINWVEKLKDNFEFEIISDYIESWTFAIIWALASKEYIDIKNARIADLYSFLEKLKEAWVKFKDLWNDILRVYRAKNIKAVNIQTNIFPAFPTDLQSPFAVLQSQWNWTSKIHEVLFEWRLNWLVELETMWAKISILNPHEALIFWPIKFKSWKLVTSWDLRAWASMVIAGIITEWITQVEKVEYIFRWYEDFVEKLQALWVDISYK
jgi:UDP-N-acetylglucosamine 1-carboxyvinyltransferase